MTDSHTFANPPILELVIGAQFSPLTKLTSGYYGLFWQSLGDEWRDPSDAPVLLDQFETFAQPRWKQAVGFRLEPVKLVTNRFLLSHNSKDKLIQIQPTRFLLNWRKQDKSYPSYRALIVEFETLFEKFSRFVADQGVGAVAVNQWELTYIDAFPHGDAWDTPADWAKVLPGLFGNVQVAENLALENRAAEWSFEIQPKVGRLHVAAKPGRSHGKTEMQLQLHMTARGPVGKDGAASLRSGLDIGHETALQTFLQVTAKNLQETWR